MRLLISSIFLLCVAATLTAQPKLINKIVAIVGDQYILLSDIEEQVAVAQERQGAKVPANLRCLVVEGAITQALLVHQAEIDSVKVSDEEVESSLDARIQQILDYMGNDTKFFEEYYGQSIEEVKTSFRADLRHQLLAERMRNQVLANAKVTPSEVKQFFRSIPSDSLPFYNAEVEMRELVIFPKVNSEEHKRALDLATDIRNRILAGEDFGALAKKYSADFGSAKQGGDLGLTRRGLFVSEFEAAAYALDYGETSPVVETKFGFHIIQTLERRGNFIRCRHILIKPEITRADLMATKERLDSIRSVILLDTISFQQAVRRFGEKSWETYNNGGTMINSATGTTYFETGDLDPDIYFAIDKLKPGDISAPIEFDAGGERAYRIVQIVSRTPPHKASLHTDYVRIQQAALEKKKNETLDKWVRRKAESVYIQIDPAYQHCDNMKLWKTAQRG